MAKVASIAAAAALALSSPNAGAFFSPLSGPTMSNHNSFSGESSRSTAAAGRGFQAYSPLKTRGGAGGNPRIGSSFVLGMTENPSENFSRMDEERRCGHLYGYGNPNHVQSILQNITEQRYQDVAEAKKLVSEEELVQQMEEFEEKNGGPVNLFRRIAKEEPDMAIAAEFKRASPSKGDIAVGINAGEQGSLYASVGAAVLSVLTEPKHFKGSLEDMKEVRLATQHYKEGKTKMRPAILRKDFIVDKYQLLEARAYGADTVLLIVAILDVDHLDDLIEACRALKMEPLVEVHTEEEMKIALRAGARVVGVNNRNLHTFELDLGNTQKAALVATNMGVPWRGSIYSNGSGSERIVLSALSGIKEPEDVRRFEEMGISMVLVGEALMRAEDPREAINTLLGKVEAIPKSANGLIKVCGVTNVMDALAAASAGANLIGVIFAEESPRRIKPEIANHIAMALHIFGERNSPKMIRPPPETVSSQEWFKACSEKLVSASRRTPLLVGVFQNQPLEEVRRIVAEADLDMVQLHGDEGIEACGDCGVPALRVVHVPASGEGEGLSAETRAKAVLDQLPPNFAAGVVLDTTVKGVQGGTGATFDHEVARLVGQAGIPVIVAGGLTPDNVEACISATNSFGVDVSSGVEIEPRQKNLPEVQRFVKGARLAQKKLADISLKKEEDSGAQ